MVNTKRIPRDVMELLKAVKDFMMDFDNWWKQPFTDSNIVLNSVQEDLHTIKQTCENFSLMLGKPVDIGDSSFPDAWSAISYAATYFIASPEMDLINTKLLQLQEVMLAVQNSQVEISHIKQTIARFDQRFTAIQSLFQAIKTIQASIAALQQNNPVAPAFQPINPTSIPQLIPISPSNSSDSDSSVRISTLEEKIRRLENRVVGDGVSIGTFVFQTLDDVRTWCATNLKSNRFGLFLDGVSIFEFLAQDHADATEVLTNLYNSQKNKFNNLYDSKVLTSCQNLFPTIFGRSSSDGLDTSRTLPGLHTADKWDHNGVTGLRFQLAREIINVDTQITNAIVVAFRDAPLAEALAKELLYRSKKFVADLSNFISQDFAFWKAKGYDKKGSWELTCCSVRRLYEDIHQVRIIARDVRDLDDPASTASLVLWATLRSHVIMEEYTKRNFYEHPSISAVIARHLAANHIKPDSSLESRMAKLEEKVADQGRCLDSFDSRIARLEQKNGTRSPFPPSLCHRPLKYKNTPEEEKES